MRLPVLLCLASLLSACGLPGSETCTVTLSGAITQTFPCTVVLAGDGMKTAMTVTGGTFNAGIDLPATVMAQDYSTAAFSQFVATGGAGVWNQSLHHTDQINHPDQGSFDIHFSSVGSAGAHAQGTVTATLPADAKTGASGTVTATITFSDSTGITGTGSGGGSGGGTGGGSGGGNGSSASKPHITFTGGMTGTIDEGYYVTVTERQGKTNFQVFAQNSASMPMSGTVNAEFTGSATTGMWDASSSTAVNVSSNSLRANAPVAQWYQNYEPGSASNRGTWTLLLTAVGTLDPIANSSNTPHGRWTSTQTVITPGGEADVVMTVTF